MTISGLGPHGERAAPPNASHFSLRIAPPPRLPRGGSLS
jgi:hypothetical protein